MKLPFGFHRVAKCLDELGYPLKLALPLSELAADAIDTDHSRLTVILFLCYRLREGVHPDEMTIEAIRTWPDAIPELCPACHAESCGCVRL